MKTFTKLEAAAYLGITVSKLYYHRYQTGHLKGRRNKYGVLEWTKAELDNFAKLDIKPGFQQRPGVKVITPGKLAELKADEFATYKGKRIIKHERAYNHTREYMLTLEDGATEFVWNNVRLEVKAVKK